jgi:hypothetical protein
MITSSKCRTWNNAGRFFVTELQGQATENQKGYRAIVLFRRGARAFFMYGFSKGQRANIDDHELKQFKAAAKHVLALSERQLAELIARRDCSESVWPRP